MKIMCYLGMPQALCLSLESLWCHKSHVTLLISHMSCHFEGTLTNAAAVVQHDGPTRAFMAPGNDIHQAYRTRGERQT